MHNPRTVFGGAAISLAMGLLLGGAMHPNLATDDRPAGPQIILGAAAQRSTGPFDPGPAYPGKVPDYVLGTDSTRAAAWQEPAAVPPPAPRIVRDVDPPPAVVLTHADYDALPPPPPHARYPSLGDELPRHAPVGQAVDDADEAPVVSG